MPLGDREMEIETFRSFIQSFENSLKIMTISPNVDSKTNYQRMKILIEYGVRISLGHDKV